MARLTPLSRRLSALLPARIAQPAVCRLCLSCRSFASAVDRGASSGRRQHGIQLRDRPQQPFARDDSIERTEASQSSQRRPSPSPSSRPWSRPPHECSGRSTRHAASSSKPDAYAERRSAAPSRAVHHNAQGEFVYGFHPVMAALQARKRQLHTVYLQADRDSLDTAATSPSSSDASVLHREREKEQLHAAIHRYSDGLPVEYMTRQQLNLLTDNRPHNGVVVDADPLQLPLADALPAPEPTFPAAASELSAAAASPLWLLLDEVQDPHNLGAVVRSAAFFGATGVVVCQKNCAPLSPVASKASSGCVETLRMQWCKSSVRLIEAAKAQGWRVVGLSAEEAGGRRRVRDCRDFHPSGATLLVVGNEGRGLRTLVKQSCDELLSIRGGSGGGTSENDEANDSLLDSLNVSTAVAVALYQCSSKRIPLPAPQAT